MTATTLDWAFRADDVTKVYKGGVRANDGITFRIEPRRWRPPRPSGAASRWTDFGYFAAQGPWPVVKLKHKGGWSEGSRIVEA